MSSQMQHSRILRHQQDTAVLSHGARPPPSLRPWSSRTRRSSMPTTPRRPRCVHGPVAPAEARCPPRRPVAPTAMLETHSDAMLTTTRASPAMAVLALLDEIEDLLGSRQARSTTSSICRTVESNLCMHAVPVHLRQSRPSSKEAVPVRSGDRRSRSHPNKRRPSFDLLM